MTASRSYRFGPFRLDADARVLFRGEDRVALTPKAVDVLVALVEARGQPVGKEELLRTVWAGTIVEEGSLTTHVSLLRKVLGEGFIETLSKRGYRFTGPTEPAAQPLRSPPATRTNLPPPLTTFIGREDALTQVCELAARSRMATLVGAGGTGKTRLSLEAARRLADAFPDGVWFVELAPLADPALVARAIATALGARAESDTPPMALIESTLRDQRVLLVLDNCEHVIDEAARVAQALLKNLPGLHVLATSREPLAIEGEAFYRVPSLTEDEAVRLFADRGAAVQPAFVLAEGNADAVALVCRRLDGIPLAIELAAARLAALSVEEMARRVDDRFRLLTGGLRTALPRHRTLRAMVDWSYDLLAPDERMVLDQLSVFAGGFSLDAAEQVCASQAPDDADVFGAIGNLVAKSLLIARTQEGGGTRYRLLETIRQYAGEKLVERGLQDGVRRRHFAYFLGLAQTAAKALAGPQALEWLDRLELEHDNLRVALDEAADDSPLGHAQLAGALRGFWDIRGHYTEGRARLTRALELHVARDPARLEALIGAGLNAHRLGDQKRGDVLLEEAIQLAQDLRHTRGEAEATLWLAWVRRHSQGSAAAERLAARALALARAAGDRRVEAHALIELGRSAGVRGDRARAEGLFLDAARLFDEASCVIDAASAIDEAGQCALERLDFAAARRLLGDALAQNRRIGNVHDAASSQLMLARVALNEQRLDEANALSSDSLRVFRSLHDFKCVARTALTHATVLRAMGDAAQALPLAESAVATYRAAGIPLQLVRALCTTGCIEASLGRSDEARRTLFSGLIEQQRADQDTYLPELLEAVAQLHADAPGAAQLLGAAAGVRERLNVVLPPHGQAERERLLADVRAKQPEAEFDRAFAAGGAMSSDEAIASALALRVTASR